jgi:hypothetical protein
MIFCWIFSISFSAGFFGCVKPVFSESNTLIATEIMYDPKGADTKHEWLEIYNSSNASLNLEGWKFFEAGTNHGLTLYQGDFILESKKYTIIADDAATFKSDYPDFSGNILDSVFSLSNSGETLALKNKTGEIVLEFSYTASAGGSGNGFSLELEDGVWRESYIEGGTPGRKNSENPVPIVYSDGIYINEILPNADEEFIELFNSTSENINLFNWKLKDASKTGKYIFSKDALIEAGGYLVVYKSDFKFALNNSGDESVYLFDPNGKLSSEVSYKSAKENISYNFDGENWRWSKFLTPGVKNQFNNLPESNEKKDKNIYAGMYADFSSKASDKDNDKLKFTWYFGDGHKSYKQAIRHKYEKIGKYKVTLKIFDGSEDKIETFDIEVKKYPERKMRIVGIMPNPEGKDSDNEYILVKNKSKKTVNLKDWSLATGSKKLYNHPITKDLSVGAGDTVKISKKYSNFSLNNKKAKLELRYPNGKVADKTSYDFKNQDAADDALYEKTDTGWQWNISQDISENKQDTKSASAILEDVQILTEDLGKQTVNDTKAKNKMILINYATNLSLPENLESSPRVLGASIVKNDSEYFFFGRPYAPEPHWTTKLLRFFEEALNSLLNKTLSFLETTALKC